MKIRKLILLTFLALLLTIAANFKVYSQTSISATATKTETVAGKNETISFLIEQNKNAREVISAQEQRIADLEAENAVERENSASVGKSYEAAKSEIANLRSANESLRKAVSLNEQTIALLQSDNTKQKEKARKATKDKWKAYGVAAVVIAIKLLVP